MFLGGSPTNEFPLCHSDVCLKHINYNIVHNSKPLWQLKLTIITLKFNFFSKKYFFIIIIYLFIYLFMYIYIYITPWNQHFIAFPMSKFNSEASVLYQIFKGNSCKVIYLSMFYDFHYSLYLFICLFMHLFTFIWTF